MSDSSEVDRCIRAMTNDGGLRLVVASLRNTVADAAAAQQVSGPIAEELGALMVGSVLLRETTSPVRRVQIALRDLAGGKLVADSLPDGKTRGLVNPVNNPEEAGRGRRMEVTYTQKNGALHKGIVEIADDTAIEAAMMTYLQESEQILTTIAMTSATLEDGNGLHAAGFVVQLLPELERSLLETMTERLAGIGELGALEGEQPLSAQTIVERLFRGLEHTILSDSAIEFGCTCSEQRFLTALSTLPRAEIDSMIEAAKPLELRCEACGQGYKIEVSALQEIP